ncbi:hypothetical protein FQR65_LT00476 [Abscondita terminalis]|nr:hypothetical protein FQR65_LT00476 [Abscondita terminalis]
MFFVLCMVAVFVINGTCRQLPTDVKTIWNGFTDPFKNECLNQSQANPEHVTLMIENAYVTDSRSFGCYLKCIFEKTGILKADGEFDFKAILEQGTYMSSDIAQNCVDNAKNETDLCLMSLIGGNCTINALSVP